MNCWIRSAEGDVYDGIISSIADFGAFVDLGGADGLIHLSELSWNRVNHPSEVVKVGQEVKVQILSVDQDRRRIGLSLRRLQPHPWDLVEEHYEVGQIVRGQITKLVNFGAFARLDKDGIEGLIHVSELSEQRVAHPKEVVSEGEEYDLRVIRIDVERRRMGLSLKQALPPSEEPELDWQIAPSEDVDDKEEIVDDFAEWRRLQLWGQPLRRPRLAHLPMKPRSMTSRPRLKRLRLRKRL